MADRTSAKLFGTIFDLLAKNPTDEKKAIAKEIWPLHSEYDFSEYQMNCDDSLIKLGLAKEGPDPDSGETCILYADYEGNFEPHA